MARPTKCRRVCCLPETLEFYPKDMCTTDPIILNVDEYETIRLIDREALSQEECGIQLGVGRTTAQKIYETARRKIADALVLGLPLKIEGGDYRLCNGSENPCPNGDCTKRQILKDYAIRKGAIKMRIAVAYEDGEIFQHFGHTEHFKIYDIDENRIVRSQIIDTNGTGHSELAGILQAMKADALICGGIGGGAQVALAEAGIKLYGGVHGNADEAVKSFLSGKLEFNPDVKCSHHDHEHGEHDHTCSSHGCGNDKCSNH